jgi:UTP--glucose-1-phosphate uridylyltransferase
LAEKWVNNEAFLLLLGDHLFRSKEARSVARQVVDRFQAFGDSQSVVGIYEEILARVKHYGTVTGEWVEEDTLQLQRISEKPTEDEAQTYLAMARHGKTVYFCVNGIYALRPALFGLLRQQASSAGAEEIQLTSALESLRQEEGVKGFLVNGAHFDTGIPSIYAKNITSFSRH